MKTKKENALSKKTSLWKEKPIDVISLIVAIFSLLATIDIGVQANNLALRSQPLDYAVTPDSSICVFSYDGKMYAQGGIQFQQVNKMPAGEFSSIFLGTVQKDSADIVYIPYESNPQFTFGYEIEDEIFFYMTDQASNKLLFSPYSMEALENTNDKLRQFHLIFKGRNREYTIFSVVYTFNGEFVQDTLLTPDGSEPVTLGKLTCYVINEENLYETQIYKQIAEDLNRGKPSGEHIQEDAIFQSIVNQRKLCSDKLKNAH